MSKKDISKAASELGRRGGRRKLEKYGKEEYRKMSRKRWANKKDQEDEKEEEQ